ncbi:hypothetical protein [Mycobacterium terramassiliense]|uniref:Membrane protein n=1 Tax=Mycobacterium terramassiliense TaxID=1841859 RepID=A0A2U3NGG5_9MYCO|nr:hypothetical protein [Mycobacterium terramassiliense]SPM30618.1 membrane protein [Mycobacterium terramassiliense]
MRSAPDSGTNGGRPQTEEQDDAQPVADDKGRGDGEGGNNPEQRARKRIRLPRRALVITVSAVLLVSSTATALWLYAFQYRADEQTGPAVAATVVKAASSGAVAVLSYKPETAVADFGAAKSHLTGDFLSYYDQFTQQVVGPAVRQKGVQTTATVIQAGVAELESDSATVVLFVNQSTISAQTPAPSTTAAIVKVGVRKVGDDWLISSFDPV